MLSTDPRRVFDKYTPCCVFNHNIVNTEERPGKKFKEELFVIGGFIFIKFQCFQVQYLLLIEFITRPSVCISFFYSQINVFSDNGRCNSY